MDEPLEEIDVRLEREVREDERLVWWGRPVPKRYARSSWALVIFGIPWTAFVILWMALALAPLLKGNPGNGGAIQVCFSLWGFPFLLIGLWLLTSPLWSRKRAKRVCYALTDQRIIILQAGMFGAVEVRSILRANLGQISKKEYADGSGDLIFGSLMKGRQDDSFGSSTLPVGFIGIENVRAIENLIHRTLGVDR